jgi:hypothetical protein
MGNRCTSKAKPHQLHEQTLPLFTYSYEDNSATLFRTNLVTGWQSSVHLSSYRFKADCYWSELPGACILITGGGRPGVREVEKIDTLREFAVSSQPPMLSPRYSHTAVSHSQYVYVLGGLTGSRTMKECERFVYAESRWEDLPALLLACYSPSAVVLENSLYVLGGNASYGYLNKIQKLSLHTLTWELMKLKLPQRIGYFPCFKFEDTQVYLVINKNLYSFSPLKINKIKTLPEYVFSMYGPSYYCRGTLYCSTSDAVEAVQIGSLPK